MENLLKQTKEICQQYGLKPSKSKGQNFLIDKNVLDNILPAAQISANDCILEIGPGLGVLTEQLTQQAKKVLAVELDKTIFYYLKQKFRNQQKLDLWQEDILKIKNKELLDRLDCRKYKVVANLPYNITKPAIRKFLEYEPKPELIVVLVQKEVAQKIVAADKKMSLLSLAVHFYGQPEIIDYVPAQSFYPQPKVESAILKIKVSSEPIPLNVKKILDKAGKDFKEKDFWRLIKIGYSSPRKQLHNNLAAATKWQSKDIRKILLDCDLSEDIRPENLTLADWAKLYIKVIV